MTRSAAVIPSADGRIALIERVRDNRLYYVFPGGGVHPGETTIEAMIREVREELGLIVMAERLLAEVTRGHEIQYYYLARVVGGQFGTGTGSEMLGLHPPERGTYKPVWVPIDHLASIAGWPKDLFEVIGNVPRDGWPDSTLEIVDLGSSPDAGDSRAA